MSSDRSHLLLAAVSAAFSIGVLTASSPAVADTITIGVTLSETGPAASLGIPEANTIALLPTEIAGQPVKYIVLDDGTDSTRAVANTRKLIDEDHVDAIIGSSVTAASLAMTPVVAEKAVPMISLAASAKLVEPVDGPRRWVFKTPQNDSLMADAVAQRMAKAGVRTVGFIGFNDAYGDGWLDEMTRAAAANGLSLVTVERYARTDTSVAPQVLKLIRGQPDAILIAAAGTPAALPEMTLRKLRFLGVIYQTHGAANNDFLRVAGPAAEATVLPVGPVLVADQLPDSNPIKQVAQTYVAAYEAANGKGSVSTFGAHAYDAGLLLQAAIPAALKAAGPGTPAFRLALRDALESQKELVVTQGVFNMSPQSHNGFDTRARVMVEVLGGTWKLLP